MIMAKTKRSLIQVDTDLRDMLKIVSATTHTSMFDYVNMALRASFEKMIKDGKIKVE